MSSPNPALVRAIDKLATTDLTYEEAAAFVAAYGAETGDEVEGFNFRNEKGVINWDAVGKVLPTIPTLGYNQSEQLTSSFKGDGRVETVPAEY